MKSQETKKIIFLHASLTSMLCHKCQYSMVPYHTVPAGDRYKSQYRFSDPWSKQSPRAWFGKFSKAIQKFGLKHYQIDYSMFYHNSTHGRIILVAYVDDNIMYLSLVVISKESENGSIHNNFIPRTQDSLDISQPSRLLGPKMGTEYLKEKNVMDLLEETVSLSTKPVDTPLDPMADQRELLFNASR